MSDKELIQICLQEISHKAGFEDPGSLRQRDLEHLSDEIEKVTGTLISLSTIKRLLNGQFNRLPQTATLNAITAYLGYENWQDFRLKKQAEIPVAYEPAPVPRTVQVKTARRWIPYKIVVLSIAVILCLTMVSLKYFSKPAPINEKDVSFSFKKVTNNDIPNTVIFTYDIDKVDGDSFFIQQSWDRDRRVRIEKNNHTLTDIYYEPGYHTAKLIVNDKVVKTIDVSIPTNGWFFSRKPSLFKGIPSYIRPAEPVKDGMLSITTEDLINSKIDPLNDNYFTYSFFPEKTDVSCDNFILKTRIRFKETRNVICPLIVHEVYGQKKSLYFYTIPAGCTGAIDMNVGEHLISGKTSDLSGFGCDVRQWQDVEVIVKNKEAKFYINQKEIFSKSYTESPGLITGLAFFSNGLLEIDNVELVGLDGKVVYKNDFAN
jgi:hypothetical protein